MKKREPSHVVITDVAQQRICQGVCPVCETPKADWTRRTDWTCCSVQCTARFRELHVVCYSWGDLRVRILFRDSGICRMCGTALRADSYEIDHIVPVALGGAQWDPDNLWTLCAPCHRKKTAEDMIGIAKQRRVEKILAPGQTRLPLQSTPSTLSKKGGGDFAPSSPYSGLSHRRAIDDNKESKNK